MAILCFLIFFTGFSDPGFFHEDMQKYASHLLSGRDTEWSYYTAAMYLILKMDKTLTLQ